MDLRDLNIWYILAIVFGAITVVSALGEWVFHWWEEPGDTLALLGLFMTPMMAAFGASRNQARRMLAMQERMLAIQERSLALQGKLLEHAERHSRLLEEVAASFRRPAEGGSAALGA